MLSCIVLGLASRLPGAVASSGKYPGDVLWAAMVFFGWGLLLPLRPLRQRLVLALASAWGIEVLKLWQTPWLVELRHSILGHLVFGQVFSWQNLVAYALGILLAVGVMRALEWHSAHHQRLTIRGSHHD
ncbi:DUF2809 domain-containing protein [Pseudomonas oryzihabitans]|uniref:ribosomal maturation YjgA family protein n=1 Tax=Pseudomonas oryzihabitans TaxID=47885 RepID=UPI00142EF105|nr:DUF2809 domain-containing protein [Pseudomonas psychrotolerans]